MVVFMILIFIFAYSLCNDDLKRSGRIKAALLAQAFMNDPENNGEFNKRIMKFDAHTVHRNYED